MTAAVKKAVVAACLLSPVVEAAVVTAGSLTSVTVAAPLYDERAAADGGCDPAGCEGSLTRDGDATTVGSRWSCKPDLGGDNAACSIIYTLGDAKTIDSLDIAMYKGDERTKTIDIYVDDAKATTWISSGTTTAFENVEVGVTGQTIELRGVLSGSDWISITEVEILVDDGDDGGDDDPVVVDNAGDDDAVIVEAGTLGTVTATAALYDPRLGSANGCDPDGCTAALTRDGDLSDASRWSCSPSLGGTCSISYDLGAIRSLSELRVALHKGDTRTRTMDVYVDGVRATTWTSSGSSAGFENVELGVAGQSVELRAVLGDSEWISITEVEILVGDGDEGGDDDPVVDDDGGDDDAVVVEAGTLGTVTATADLFDLNLASANGCDPDGCTAALTRDGDLSEASRWSCTSSLGGTCKISYDLGVVRNLSELRLAMYKGSTRVRTVEVRLGAVLAATWTSSGTTDGFESIDLSGYSGRYLTVMTLPDDSQWLSIVETEIMVLSGSDEVSTPSPVATVTPAPATVQPVSPPGPTPGGTVQTVGLTPLARGGEPEADRYAAKDGDLSTSWTCTGDPREPNDSGVIYYDCDLSFGLVYYRNIKQVKIALADGDQRPVEMRIATGSDTVEVFVTSSGTTTDLETYDFDYKTSSIEISAVFSEPGQSITISEVEFLEEVVEGEVLLDRFNTPYNNEDGLWYRLPLPGLAWTSETDESIGDTLSFGLAGHFTVTEMQLRFPVGDTYKFDLALFNGLDGTGEAFVTISDLESVDQEGWQSFDMTSYADQSVDYIILYIKGTGSGAPGFTLLDANFLGEEVVVPTDTFYVGSARIEYWEGDAYPDFVAEGTGDQDTINAAICAVKKATYDGVDCVGGDDNATGTVILSPDGSYYVDGSIIMKSGVKLEGWYNQDNGVETNIILEEQAAGKADMKAIVVMDDITDAWVQEIWIRGLYDSETDDGSSGLGPACLSVENSQNITCGFLNARSCDGDAMVVRNSNGVNIDAGKYDDELLPWSLGRSRGTGLIVDSSDSVYIRRHTMYDNGIAGLHVMGSNNFTFEATVRSEEEDSSQGSVGSLDGQQPIEIIIESSTLLTFTDMRVLSVNDPVMTISDSTGVSFSNLALLNVPTGTCVIETDDPSTVTINVEEDELELQNTCYVKV